MSVKPGIRRVQTLLVLGALTFAAVGYAAPQQASRGTACATALNPEPPCNCNEYAECQNACYVMCGLNYFAFCQPNDEAGSWCESGPTYEYNGICQCYCM